MSSIPNQKNLSLSSSSPQPEKSNSFIMAENNLLNKNSPKTTDQNGYEEMSKMIATLMENSALQEIKINDETKLNQKLKEEMAKLKSDNVVILSYKDKFNDVMFTYSQKEKEIETLQSKVKKRNGEIEQLKRHFRKLKT